MHHSGIGTANSPGVVVIPLENRSQFTTHTESRRSRIRQWVPGQMLGSPNTKAPGDTNRIKPLQPPRQSTRSGWAAAPLLVPLALAANPELPKTPAFPALPSSATSLQRLKAPDPLASHYSTEKTKAFKTEETRLKSDKTIIESDCLNQH